MKNTSLVTWKNIFKAIGADRNFPNKIRQDQTSSDEFIAKKIVKSYQVFCTWKGLDKIRQVHNNSKSQILLSFFYMKKTSLVYNVKNFVKTMEHSFGSDQFPRQDQTSSQNQQNSQILYGVSAESWWVTSLFFLTKFYIGIIPGTEWSILPQFWHNMSLIRTIEYLVNLQCQEIVYSRLTVNLKGIPI